MKTCTLLFLALAIGPFCPAAETLRNAGILGNSGEQGATLVKFGEKPASGMGVVYDRFGSLWDRGGDGVLNRYAPDGRLLASYPIAPTSAATDRETLVALGDTLLLKIGKKLYTLPITAPAGTKPTLLPVSATRLSISSSHGWVAAADGKTVFAVNEKGETRPIADAAEVVEDIEMAAEGSVYAGWKSTLTRMDSGPGTPQPGLGERPQWLAGHWFSSTWHGTIRRFSPELAPTPGVVLGGASGSFIGHVDGNYELGSSRGLALLGGPLFASSGYQGVLHLLEWHNLEQRFSIVRRLGAAARCTGLALDGKGRIWFHSGVWNWADGPDVPLEQGVPPPEANSLAAGAMLGDVMVLPALRYGKPSVYYGPLDEPARVSDKADGIPANAAACVAVTMEKRPTLIVVNAAGQGAAVPLASTGAPQPGAKPTVLKATKPLSITSLAAHGADGLRAASGGEVVEFTRDGADWRETARWKSWGSGDDAHFGARLQLAESQGRLWIADTDRQRVVCLDADSKALLASFGTADHAGRDLTTLDAPATLAANGRRAVVYDSGNQRFVKLELSAR